MKKNLTELVMILDRSGSMGGLESDTIGGYNSMLKKQREAEGEVLVSTVLFDDRTEVLYDRVPLEKLPQMTEKEYRLHGAAGCSRRRGQTHRKCPQVREGRGPSGKNDICDHHGRSGKRELRILL